MDHVGTLSQLIPQPLRRTLAARRLRRQIEEANDLRVMIGASGTDMDGWIATEQSLVDLLQPETWARFFQPHSVDAVIAEHVWEHLTLEQGRVAAATCFQFLRAEGYLRVAVPDGNHPSPDYIERVRPGGIGLGADDHKVLYNFRTFGDIFRQAGFQVRLIEYFDDDGQFHTADWDVAKGLVRRTLLFDERNARQAYGYTSLFLDATKPRETSQARAA
jgi:predicted SAM-dependent methyltransferase